MKDIFSEIKKALNDVIKSNNEKNNQRKKLMI